MAVNRRCSGRGRTVQADLPAQFSQLRLLQRLDAVDAPRTEALPGSAQQAGGVVQLGTLVEAEVDLVAVKARYP
jgi:hypothetical protein